MAFYSFNQVDCFIKEISSSTSITLAFFLDVGLPSEGNTHIGMSHFLEHMCFRGTKHRSAYDITKEVDALGGQINAYTTKEFTCYFITLLPENIDEGLDILTDIVFNSTLNMPDIELEKSIIGEEIKMYEDTPDEKIIDLFNQELFDNAYLGQPILGTFNSISGFNSELLTSFYQHYFQPGNVKCVISGAIDSIDSVQDSLQNALSTIQFKPNHNSKVLLNNIQFQAHDLHVEKELEQMHYAMGFPGISYNHDDRYALTILSTILGGSMSSRLFQSVREREGLAYSIYCSPSFYRDTGSIMIYAGTSIQNQRKAIDCIQKELDLLLLDGISVEEFERSKQQLKGNIIINLEGSSAWANWLGRQFIYKTGLSEITEIQDRLTAVSIDDVTRVARQSLNNDYKVSVSLGVGSSKD